MSDGPYHVDVNRCKCHPETCCCNDWAIFDKDGKRHSAHHTEKLANEFCDLLNLREKRTP